ncbi:molybdenum cofactor cytidylyltransferase [Dethiobacter alkaliphilus]|uniref:molybdenum cofactor cytidylyltransferase n=1 Tax=Dethiobacter alkaliphilus TaxID=427926 RepID=UPI002227AD99|nr:molybdenum cofactor cytidylyltransferase [Dethiobacter alkaliphilus]MCW3490138.1 molybdenum cofactor cytidylyltransferase [Dethiobacter alkaliphilus]
MIYAIVLAAGTSSRMQTPKQLLTYQGRPLIRHTVETIVKSKAERVLVVVGAEAQEVCAALEGLPVQIVVNERYAQGQSTSVKKGLAALTDKEPHGVLFALGDQPLLKSETIDTLINSFLEYNGIIVPYYQQAPGNPVIFAQKYLPEFNSLSGDMGGRAVIKRFAKNVRRVDVADEGVVIDIDTRQDYEKLLGRSK